MGDNIVDDGQMVVQVAGQQAGGEAGQLILNNVNFAKERENTNAHGIGNKEPQGMKFGNITYTFSSESQLNEAAADLLRELSDGDDATEPTNAFIRAEDTVEVRIGKIYWNTVEWDSNDDGDIIVTVNGDCMDVVTE